MQKNQTKDFLPQVIDLNLPFQSNSTSPKAMSFKFLCSSFNQALLPTKIV